MSRFNKIAWALTCGFAYLMACMGSVVVLAVILGGIELVAGDWAYCFASVIFIITFAYIIGREITKR